MREEARSLSASLLPEPSSSLSPVPPMLRFALLATLLLTTAWPAWAQPTADDREARARSLGEALVNRDMEAAQALDLTPQMQQALTPALAEQVMGALEQSAGPFQEITGTRSATFSGRPVAYVLMDFAEAERALRVVFDDENRIAGLQIAPPGEAQNADAAQKTGKAGTPQPAYTLPDYADTTAFREEEVTVDAGAGTPLGATLTLPTGAASAPGVVLVHGSGPNDRDESVGPNKPLRDLAAGLASRGIAVLRYDKRTRAYPEAFAGTAYTTDKEVTNDALAAALLRQRPEVDNRRVFVLGHSLGGMMAPRIARRDTALAGIILAAAAARSLPELLRAQADHLDAHDSTVDVAAIHDMADQIEAITPGDSSLTAPVAGAPASYWLDLRDYDPVTAAALERPTLILQGERDYQVTMAEDFAAWKDALGDAGNVTLKSYPRLNHHFIAGDGPSTPGEYQQLGHVDAQIVAATAAWIEAR